MLDNQPPACAHDPQKNTSGPCHNTRSMERSQPDNVEKTVRRTHRPEWADIGVHDGIKDGVTRPANQPTSDHADP
jgi:hypothetical protein